MLTDQLRAVRVLSRRGMVEPLRPHRAVHAALAVRRYGPFGGLIAHAARRYGNAPALADDRGTMTFADLEHASNALARGLQAHGVCADSVIAVLYRNQCGVLLALSAANRIGARVVLMNTGFAAPQLADVCTRERVGVLLTDDEFDEMLGALPATVERLDLHELIYGMTTSRVPVPPRPGGMVLLTSGTTGTQRRSAQRH